MAELSAIPVGLPTVVLVNFMVLRTVKRRHARNGSHGQADKTSGDSFIAMIAGRHGMLSQQKRGWAKKASLRETCAVM